MVNVPGDFLFTKTEAKEFVKERRKLGVKGLRIRKVSGGFKISRT